MERTVIVKDTLTGIITDIVFFKDKKSLLEKLANHNPHTNTFQEISTRLDLLVVKIEIQKQFQLAVLDNNNLNIIYYMDILEKVNKIYIPPLGNS